MAINDFFDGICHEAIWDANKTWNTSEPNFNRCLRHTILTWIPCAFLFVFSLIQILSIRASKLKKSSWRLLNSSRLVFTILALIANVVEFAFYVKEYLSADRYPYILFVSSAVKVFAFVILAVLLVYQKDKGVPSIAAPWLFLFIHIICFIPTISQLWLHKETLLPFEVCFNSVYFSLLLILFILSSFADLHLKSKRRSLLEEEEGEDTDGEEKQRSPCPESSASFPSLFLFWWFTGLTYLGYKKPLVTDDIFDLNEEDKGEVIVPKFERNWYLSGVAESRSHSTYSEVRIDRPSNKRSIIKTVAKTCWFDLTIAAVLLCVNYACQLLSPLLLQSLLKFMSSKDPKWHGFVIVLGMFCANILSNLNLNAYYLKTAKLTVQMKSCLTNMIYKKSLRISASAKKSSTSGEVVNLMSVDSQRILNVLQYFFFIFATPVVIAVALWLLYVEMGYAVFGGLVVLAFMIPTNYFCSRFASNYESKQMKLKDERLKYLNETLNGMRVLKLYAWEPSFIKLISEIRVKEMKACKMDAYIYALLSFQWNFAPFLIGFVTFAIYAFSDKSHVLTAEKIFVTLNLIDILNLPLAILPNVVASCVQAYVSAKRIDKYLNAPELQGYVTHDESNFAVEVKNGKFRWDSLESNENNETSDNRQKADATTSTSDTLVDINLKVKLGSLHAVVGQVGSGKSSLLSAILGEMEKMNGSVNIHRRLKIAYVSQQAWIENLTLRDNILFGKQYYREKFEEIIDACALRPDLDILPAGELTEIGEKGINLSGGQKQRVSLARAAYSDADLYLFDDPLSAVDAHVAKHLYDHLLSSKRGLLKQKTRILVTNRLDILPKVDFITVLKDGKISEQGTYSDLIERQNDFADFVKEFSGGSRATFERQESISTEVEESKSDSVDEKKEQKNKKKDTLVEEEAAEVGRVKFDVYRKYFKMISAAWGALIVTAVAGYHLSQVAGNIWLSHWSNDNVTGDVKHDTAQRNYRFEIYAVIGFVQIIMGCFGNVAFIGAGLSAAVKFHRRLLDRIFRSPMSFFETTPLGRILNRFSKDMDSLDSLIPWVMKGVVDRLLQAIVALSVIAAQTGAFILIILPLSVAYYFIQRLYIPTSRQLQRLHSITRSPIYAHFAQTLQGVSTIRAFNEVDRFTSESDKKVELNLICNYALNVAAGWLNVFLNIFGSLVVLFVGFYAAFQRDSLTAGMVGLSITYSLMITKILNWLVRNAVAVETNIVSVERINEYCENVTEAEWINNDYRPPINWPERGIVEFDKYATRYRPGLDLVLNNVTAAVNGCEKIGIVGRTGAGKSTITLSLFRILEAVKGKIVIDGVNIANLGLHDLRSKLTIIPQDPVLFSGTLRFNLDPFDAYSDHQIWEALKHSHLHQFVSSLEKGISHEIAEGGENLSVGQRQLMCLARALLRKSKILILDEATAAVDLETDSLIQNTIRSEFANCTTLTIAHRIQTILDCDRIMVIDKGTVIEFNSPSNLLSNTSSTFYSLAKNAGIVTSSIGQ